jgi:hypothetical protein
MTKILRNAPWLFLYVVLLHTNIAAMDKNSKAMEHHHRATVRKNQDIIKKRNERIFEMESTDQYELIKAYKKKGIFAACTVGFEDNVRLGYSCSQIAQHMLDGTSATAMPDFYNSFKTDSERNRFKTDMQRFFSTTPIERESS